MTALVIVLGALAVVLAAVLAYRSRPPKRLRLPKDARRILVPFTGDILDPTVLNAAIRIAHAEHAVLVPAYLLLVPLKYSLESPVASEVAIAMPLLEAVEHAALRAGIPVDARIEKGRTATHALGRLWDVERFDRIIAPAPAQTNGSSGNYGTGFTPKDLTWILTHAPAETLVLRPAPAGAPAESANVGRARAPKALTR